MSNWIGVVLSDAPGFPTLGAMVVVNTERGNQIAQVINGDSFNCQHAATLHFGLGGLEKVIRIEVTWPNGTTRVLTQPRVNAYHKIVGHAARVPN